MVLRELLVSEYLYLFLFFALDTVPQQFTVSKKSEDHDGVFSTLR